MRASGAGSLTFGFWRITLGTDCAGMEAPVQALRNMDVDVDHRFSCDIDAKVRQTSRANFDHRVTYTDVTTRDNNCVDSVD
eukprot:901000-Karenia_brevis.AAC.1